MAQFTYTARTKTGDKAEGTVDATDRRGALIQIEKMGYVPVSLADRAAAPGRKRGSLVGALRGVRKRMRLRELVLFTGELSDLLASGMTLGNALNALANRQSSPGVTAVISDLRDEIVRGASLSDALTRHPGTFSNLYVNMIRAGEASGAMGEVLGRLVKHFERIQETREKVIMALVYPCIVLVMGIGTLIFSMVYVIPKFKDVFEKMNAALPLPTQILISGSAWMVKWGWLLAAAALAGAIMARQAVRTEKGKMWWHGTLLRMPLIRGVVASGIFANFARTLETLLANGVPVLQALGIVEQIIGNAVIKKEIRNARSRVTDGTTISGPLAAGKVFPALITDMLSIGEQTGDMCGALSHISRRYESELERNLKIFTTALEPILIVLVAVMVGFVAISILMAVFSLSSGMGSA